MKGGFVYRAKRRQSKTVAAAIAVTAATLLLAACSSSGSKTSNETSTPSSVAKIVSATCGPKNGVVTPSPAPIAVPKGSAPGVTADKITVGLVADLSGVFGAQFKPDVDAFKAVVNCINANGGVNGRKIDLIEQDSQSTLAANLAAAQSLVEAKKVFMVVEIAPLFGGAPAEYLGKANIPVVTLTAVPTVSVYNSFFNPQGGFDSNPNHYTDTIGQIFKLAGATKVGAMALGTAAAGKTASETALASVKSVGLQAGYTNYTVQQATTNWTPYILGFKNSNTDGWYGVLDTTGELNFLTTANQQGLKLKVVASNLFNTKYLTGPSHGVMQGVYTTTNFRPPSLPNDGVAAEIAILSGYNGPSGTPDAQISQGYMVGQVFNLGLRRAGTNLTREGFISNLRSVTNWDGTGLAPKPVNFSVALTDPPVYGSCVWPLKAQGNDFVPVQDTPVCNPTKNLP